MDERDPSTYAYKREADDQEHVELTMESAETPSSHDPSLRADLRGPHAYINVADLPPEVQEALVVLANSVRSRQTAYQKANEEKREALRVGKVRELKKEVEEAQAKLAEVQREWVKARTERDVATKDREHHALATMHAQENMRIAEAELQEVREQLGRVGAARYGAIVRNLQNATDAARFASEAHDAREELAEAQKQFRFQRGRANAFEGQAIEAAKQVQSLTKELDSARNDALVWRKRFREQEQQSPSAWKARAMDLEERNNRLETALDKMRALINDMAPPF